MKLSENRQVGRPRKDPTQILNKRFSFLTNLKQFTLIELFEDRGQSMREIIFNILPAMISVFIDNSIEMDLSDEQWDIIQKIQKWGDNDT